MIGMILIIDIHMVWWSTEMRRVFWRYALWMIPITIASNIIVYYICRYFQYYSIYPNVIVTIADGLYYSYVFHHNSYEHKQFYRDDFSPTAQIEWRRKGLSQEKLRALYSKPRKTNLFRKPTGVILGATNDRYVCIPLDPHNLVSGTVIGAPGSGKSSGPLISTLTNLYDQRVPVTCFVVDIKGELSFFSTDQRSPSIVIINPDDHSAYGWDPYYDITQNSSDDEILEALDKISRSIIIDSNPRNAFFVNQARKILKGVALAYYRRQVWTDDYGIVRQGFADAMCELQSKNIATLINEDILTDNELIQSHPQIALLLNEFHGEETEAIQGIKLQLSEHLDIFTRSDVKWMLSPENPHTTSPLDLNNGKSIFLSIPETKLDSYATVFRMIVYQTISAMEKRNNEDVCLMLIDEMPRLGKLDILATSGLATLRSKNISLWLFSQDFSQLQYVYGHDAARMILNLCEVTCVLSCRDIETGKMLSEWSGYYEERKKSRTHRASASKQSGSVSTSEERRPVVDIADVMRLRTEGGVMLWIEGRYCRVRRIRYFEDKRLNRIAQHNADINKIYKQKTQVKQNFPQEILFFDENTLTDEELHIDSLKTYEEKLNELLNKEKENHE